MSWISGDDENTFSDSSELDSQTTAGEVRERARQEILAVIKKGNPHLQRLIQGLEIVKKKNSIMSCVSDLEQQQSSMEAFYSHDF